MSHRIIVSSKAASDGTGVPVAEHEESQSVTYEITYTPSHDLTPEQVGDKVAKLLKLAAKMNE